MDERCGLLYFVQMYPTLLVSYTSIYIGVASNVVADANLSRGRNMCIYADALSRVDIYVNMQVAQWLVGTTGRN